MVPGTTQLGSFTGAGELLAHLRQHPEDLQRSPSDLAATFGLNDIFVRTVLEGVQVPRSVPKVKRELGINRFFHKIGHSLHQGFEKLNRKPIALTIGIAVGWALLVILASHLVPGRGLHAPKSGGGATVDNEGGVELGITVLAIFASMAVFYRQRMSRFPVIFGVAVFLASTVMFIPVVLGDNSDQMSKLGSFVLAEVAWFFLALMYVGLGSLVAVFAAWRHMRRTEREKLLRSRHELLTRYFDIEQRLQQATATTPPNTPNRLVASIQRSPYWWGFGTSVGLTVIARGLLNLVPVSSLKHPESKAALVLVGAGAGIIQIGVFVFITFLAGRPGRAAITSLCFSLGSLVAYAFPRITVEEQKLTSAGLAFAHIGGAVVNAGLAAIIGLGALVQRQAQRDRLLARNDPATLMAELLQIQYALSEGQAEVCVMVVDAVKSSLMKSTVDPLLVEFSFRAYQAWIDRICARQNGRVFTTTGDGAIVAFGTCAEALVAAYELQEGVARFNAEENRLKAPFQLRIGLHVGAVVAGLEKVEFTQVIDIAAHVEHVAPIGGVALTDAVVERLTGHHFDPLLDDVDGHRVLVARKLPPS